MLTQSETAAATTLNRLEVPAEWLETATAATTDWLAFGFLIALAGCILLELHRPFLRRRLSAVKHSYRINLTTFLFNEITLSLLSISSLYYLAEACSGSGLLSPLEDGAVKFLLSFILLDFILYAWHYVMHHVDLLWVFHKVHHSDPSLNVTTGLRCHVGELGLEFLVRAAFILAAGVDAAVIVVAQGIISLFVLLHHANLTLAGERWLSWVFIVPRLHRVHHSVLREEHDSNYGAVFSVWDRCFGTLQQREPVAIGLPGNAAPGFIDLVTCGLTGASVHTAKLVPVAPQRNTP